MLLLAACSSVHDSAHPLAVVAGQPITRAQVNAYVTYTAAYDAWAAGQAAAYPLCRPPGQTSPPCRRAEREALARLIEERSVLAWAKQHGVALSAADRARAAAETNRLMRQTNQRGVRLQELGVTRAFVEAVVEREILVRAAELAVTARVPMRGPSFHLRKYLLPVSDTRSSRAAYRQALDLATAGQPVPAGAQVRTQWVAVFRLPLAQTRLLAAAQPGQFIGPFRLKQGYLVLELLRAAWHRYGRPARLSLMAQAFHAWLIGRLQSAPATCFDARGKRTACSQP